MFLGSRASVSIFGSARVMSRLSTVHRAYKSKDLEVCFCFLFSASSFRAPGFTGVIPTLWNLLFLLRLCLTLSPLPHCLFKLKKKKDPGFIAKLPLHKNTD